MTSDQARRYNRILAWIGPLALVVGFAVAAVFGHLSANFWVFRCAAAGYSADRYLSYCADPAYGDYEHGALYYPTEPEAAANAKAAQILFLGNSRASAAFSADTLRDGLDRLGLRMFNLAFNGEFDLFPKTLIERHDMRPRYVVVNVDYFFYNSVNVLGRRVFLGGAEAALEYRLKRWAQSIHADLCRQPVSRLGGLVCGDGGAEFRSRTDGRIVKLNWPVSPEPRSVGSATGLPESIYPALEKAAAEFKRFTDGRGACLILVAIPAPDASPEVARRLAAALQTPLVEVPDRGFDSFDGSHMTPAGADLWGTEFTPRLQAAMARCHRA